eukprot:6172032-Pleurochrysis_carterae.AAC.1
MLLTVPVPVLPTHGDGAARCCASAPQIPKSTMSPTRRAVTLALAAMHAPPSLFTRSQLLTDAGAAHTTGIQPMLASLQASLGAAPASAAPPVIAGDDRFVLALPTGFVASKRNAKQARVCTSHAFNGADACKCPHRLCFQMVVQACPNSCAALME